MRSKRWWRGFIFSIIIMSTGLPLLNREPEFIPHVEQMEFERLWIGNENLKNTSETTIDNKSIGNENLKNTSETTIDNKSPDLQFVHNRFCRSERNSSGVKSLKTILYWNTIKSIRFEEEHYFLGHGEVFKNCPVPYCYVTTERDLHKSLDRFDAILFHGTEINKNDLPTVRSEMQRYIYFSWESPASRPIIKHEFLMAKNFYNWTMSYRLDSDIPRPYGLVRDVATNAIVAPKDNVIWRMKKYSITDPALAKLINAKRRMVAWFVSHCKTDSRREDFVKQLAKYIEVDKYGSCGRHKCNNKRTDCYGKLEREYFFYLSFENTLCVDYVTEKLFLVIQKNIVPIVYGGANYSKFVPPHSYIDVLNFSNGKQLALYLKHLTKHLDEYVKYFWWKRYYKVEETTEVTKCRLCQMLHDTKLPRKSIRNFRKYYQFQQCHPPQKP